MFAFVLLKLIPLLILLFEETSSVVIREIESAI